VDKANELRQGNKSPPVHFWEIGCSLKISILKGFQNPLKKLFLTQDSSEKHSYENDLSSIYPWVAFA
jgi:hypothetical protein